MNSLLDYIKGQQPQLETPDFDALERINEFKNNINLFYSKIQEEWLKELDGYVQYRRCPYSISEEMLGTYSVEALKVHMHHVTIEFRPVGTILIGSPGRIDMYVNHKENQGMFLMIREKLERMRPFNVNQIINGKREATKPAADEDLGAFVWKYVDTSGDREYISLNAQTFQQILLSKII